jgi:hypothetical protein
VNFTVVNSKLRRYFDKRHNVPTGREIPKPEKKVEREDEQKKPNRTSNQLQAIESYDNVLLGEGDISDWNVQEYVNDAHQKQNFHLASRVPILTSPSLVARNNEIPIHSACAINHLDLWILAQYLVYVMTLCMVAHFVCIQ